MTQQKLADSYKLIMWGVLITTAHIIIWNLQLIPAFIGHFLIYKGIKALHKEVGMEYLDYSFKMSKLLLIVSVVYWVWGALMSYSSLLTQCIEIFLFVVEIAVFGDLLNKTVKLLKENDRVKYADKMRQNRMTFIKLYLGVVLVFVVTLIPALQELRIYAAPTLMLSVKIFLSLLIQNVPRSQVDFKAEAIGGKDVINS